jgi:hypothetical protein
VSGEAKFQALELGVKTSGRWLLKPELRLVRDRILSVSWGFLLWPGVCPGYASASGIGAPMRSKASCWVLVASASPDR